MADPKLNFAHVCENAFVSQDGKLSIIGIFNQIGASNFPALHPKLSIVTNVSGDIKEYIEAIAIISPRNEVIAKAENKITISREDGSANFIADFIGVVFPIDGKYTIRIIVDSKVINEENYIILSR